MNPMVWVHTLSHSISIFAAIKTYGVLCRHHPSKDSIFLILGDKPPLVGEGGLWSPRTRRCHVPNRPQVGAGAGPLYSGGRRLLGAHEDEVGVSSTPARHLVGIVQDPGRHHPGV